MSQSKTTCSHLPCSSIEYYSHNQYPQTIAQSLSCLTLYTTALPDLQAPFFPFYRTWPQPYKSSYPTLHVDLPDSYCTVPICVPQTDPAPSNRKTVHFLQITSIPNGRKKHHFILCPAQSLRPTDSRRLEKTHGYGFNSSLKPLCQLTNVRLEENILCWFKRNAKAHFATERNNERRLRSLVTGQYVPKYLGLAQLHRLVRTR